MLALKGGIMDPKLLRKYLLGDPALHASPRLLREVEAVALHGNQPSPALLEAEDTLFQDFVMGNLSAQETSSFQGIYQTSEKNLAKHRWREWCVLRGFQYQSSHGSQGLLS